MTNVELGTFNSSGNLDVGRSMLDVERWSDFSGLAKKTKGDPVGSPFKGRGKLLAEAEALEQLVVLGHVVALQVVEELAAA